MNVFSGNLCITKSTIGGTKLTSMTAEEFKQLKEGYLELVVKIITESGGLTPAFTILGTHKPDGKYAICLVPIENKFMQDEESKDFFIDIIVPEIAEKTRELIDIQAIGWASEAWMRVADKTTTRLILTGRRMVSIAVSFYLIICK